MGKNKKGIILIVSTHGGIYDKDIFGNKKNFQKYIEALSIRQQREMTIEGILEGWLGVEFEK